MHIAGYNFHRKLYLSSSYISGLVLRFRHMLSLRMKPCDGVRGVVDNLKLALLVIVAVPPVQHSVSVPLLVLELPVVAHPGVVAIPVAVWSTLAVDLEGNLLWL